jgi:hypothetical protein
MNDIVKQNIKEKLQKAIEAEKLLAQEVADLFGLHPSYISWIKNPKYWERCPVSFWENLLKWVNSGQSLKEYSEKHGKVLPAKEEPKSEVKVKVGDDGKISKEEWEKNRPPEVKIKTPFKSKPENQEPKRASKGELLDMLIEEKALLQQKIDAIDVLLRYYISV